MCLVLLAWHAHPDYPLVVAANRDEFYVRPTAPAAFWDDSPAVLAGRDLEAGGTWLGVTRTGRFAALTNFRDPSRKKARTPSRGRLVSEFLLGAVNPDAYLRVLKRESVEYNGFNLIFGQGHSLLYFSNCGDQAGELEPGIYGLSNHLLDTPWPKVAQGKSALASALGALPDDTRLLALLRDQRVARDEELPRTGVSLEWERLLSAAFIHSLNYGTRSSTTIILERGGRVRFKELSYSEDAQPIGQVEFDLTFPVFLDTSGDSNPSRP